MGSIEIFHDVPFSDGSPRTVRVYLPDEYAAHTARDFPVLYLHDGQNVWDHPGSAIADTWGANVALDALIAEGAIEPWIAVAVDHAGVARLSEYSPWDEPRFGVQARGAQYARFVIDTLLPWVHARYRARAGADARAVAGSSMGALMALHLARAFPAHFGRVAALSPTVMWAEHAMSRAWSTHSGRFSKLYLDAGEHERLEVEGGVLDYGAATRAFYEHLRAVGYGEHEVRLLIEPEGAHHERDWRRRLPAALRWVLAG